MIGGLIGLIGVGGGILMLMNGNLFKPKQKKEPSSKEPLSIDDIPLDELEMPWHKWER
jgi:hypothetical protein